MAALDETRHPRGRSSGRPVAVREDLVAEARAPLGPAPELRDLLRFATLAASGHNTQPWRFALSDRSAVVLPDLTRRTPVVDPDDHHLYASLGCAAETLSIAAAARGRDGTVRFEPRGEGRLVVDLSPARAREGPRFPAIPARQCTRSVYDGRPLSAADLDALVAAAAEVDVDAIPVTGGAVRAGLEERVIAANAAQVEDAAFVRELKSWLRFNAAAAVATRDGLYSASAGNPTLPTAVGNAIFPLVFTKAAETRKLTRQMRSTGGYLVLVARTDDPAGWAAAGRAYQRVALEATARGLAHAFLNQPVEVAAARADLADLLGVGGRRPDLVLRLGRAAPMPRSLRRPVEAVLA